MHVHTCTYYSIYVLVMLEMKDPVRTLYQPNCVESNPDCLWGLEFWIFGVFGWAHSLVLVDKPGFERVRRFVCPDLGLGLAHFWPNMLEVCDIWRIPSRFEVQFW